MLLDGRELAGFIKERQARTVRRLRARKITPTLAIVQAVDDAVTDKFTRAKQRYGQDIGVEVAIHKLPVSRSDLVQDRILKIIEGLNEDAKVHGIIVQLPLPDGVDVDKVLDLIKPNKDVDGLGSQSRFDPATPTAILWLLAGYNIDLKEKEVLIVGKGRLVGKPIKRLLEKSHIKVVALDEHAKDLATQIKQAEVIISGTGQPGLIKSSMIKKGAAVIDAGTSSEGGKLVGDADPKLYERQDVKISPTPGGVGPLTVCALFGNVIQAAGGRG
ncbi:bifunctional 5,10-methylenetetrahydrofolate dehydrogenase/5,10-methenyltetrahydrofolate cyclohydrolase [Candidatus Microgenomates bacterium]|nr:bifunctional 5,10-methylenetetrahydrofolate dehydrogenase/5,10-methenyltetrahydrofolate cyclohydrolase [Candidatus Microgenomates bacterium]